MRGGGYSTLLTRLVGTVTARTLRTLKRWGWSLLPFDEKGSERKTYCTGNDKMGPTYLHIFLTTGAIGLGIYLYSHPILLRGQSNLVRGVIIWTVLVLVLRALDYAFLN